MIAGIKLAADQCSARREVYSSAWGRSQPTLRRTEGLRSTRRDAWACVAAGSPSCAGLPCAPSARWRSIRRSIVVSVIELKVALAVSSISESTAPREAGRAPCDGSVSQHGSEGSARLRRECLCGFAFNWIGKADCLRPTRVGGVFPFERPVDFGNGRSPNSSRRSEFDDSGRSREATSDRDKIAREWLHPKAANWHSRPVRSIGTAGPERRQRRRMER